MTLFDMCQRRVSGAAWTSCQIRKIAGCACTGNAGNIFPRRRLQRKPLVSDPGMHHGTCVTHVPWCMSGSHTRGGGENVFWHSRRMRTRNFTYLVRGPWGPTFSGRNMSISWLVLPWPLYVVRSPATMILILYVASGPFSSMHKEGFRLYLLTLSVEKIPICWTHCVPMTTNCVIELDQHCFR